MAIKFFLIFPPSSNSDRRHEQVRGQTFLEFVLLMATMMVMATSILKIVNLNIGKIWVQYVNTITESSVTLR